VKKEFRIGNIVEIATNKSTVVTIVEEILQDGIVDIHEVLHPYKNINLITINHFYLSDIFGFINDGLHTSFYYKDNFVIHKTKDGWNVLVGAMTIEIKYVHQIQNLYKSITGNELEFKL